MTSDRGIFGAYSHARDRFDLEAFESLIRRARERGRSMLNEQAIDRGVLPTALPRRVDTLTRGFTNDLLMSCRPGDIWTCSHARDFHASSAFRSGCFSLYGVLLNVRLRTMLTRHRSGDVWTCSHTRDRIDLEAFESLMRRARERRRSILNEQAINRRMTDPLPGC
jgi:hypothetical protein